MADKQFQVVFRIQALDQATGIIQKVKANLQGIGTVETAHSTLSLNNLKQAASSLQSELTQLPLGLGAIASTAIASVTGVLSFQYALNKLHSTISEGLAAYSHAALNSVQLGVAWQMSGRTLPVEAVKQYGAALAESTNFSVGAIASATRMMSIFPAITGELMPKALQAAADLAAFNESRGMTLEDAAQKLGQASEGMLVGLTRYGVHLSQTSRETKDFKHILDDVAESMGGQAALAAGTYHGQLEKLDHQYVSLKKSIGSVIEPAILPALSQWQERIGAFAKSFGEAVKGNEFSKVQELIGALAMGFEKLAEEIGKSLANWLKFLESLGGEGDVKPSSILESVFGKGGLGLSAESTGGGLFGLLGYKEGEQVFKYDPVGDWLDSIAKKGKTALAEIKGTKEGLTKVGEPIDWSRFGTEEKTPSAGTGPLVDWKLKGIEAQAYYTRLQEQAKLAYEAEKAEIESTAKSKEEAERRIFDAGEAYSQKRIAIAIREHDTILADREKQWAKEEQDLAGRFKTEGKEGKGLEQVLLDRAEALKEFNQQKAKEQAEIEKKLTEVIVGELEKRYSEIQKHQQALRDLDEKMKDAQVEGVKALAEVTGKAVSESARVEAKFAEMRDTLSRAAEALPTMPEKAIQLAQQARGMAAGLVQDINALRQSFKDFQQSTEEGLLGIQKRGMSPIEGWYADIQMYESLMAKARQAQAGGSLEEAQKLAAQASQKAQGLANAPEGVSVQDSVRVASGAFMDAAKLEANVRGQIIGREEQRQTKAEAAVREANRIQQEAIKNQIETVKNEIKALDANTEALRQVKAVLEKTSGQPGAPSVETSSDKKRQKEIESAIGSMETGTAGKAMSEEERKTAASAAAYGMSPAEYEAAAKEAGGIEAFEKQQMAMAGVPQAPAAQDAYERMQKEDEAAEREKQRIRAQYEAGKITKGQMEGGIYQFQYNRGSGVNELVRLQKGLRDIEQEQRDRQAERDRYANETPESERGKPIAGEFGVSFGLGRLKDWLQQAGISSPDMGAIADEINARREDMAARARQVELDRVQAFYKDRSEYGQKERAGISGTEEGANLMSGATAIQEAGGMFKEAVAALRQVLGDVRVTVMVNGQEASATSVDY